MLAGKATLEEVDRYYDLVDLLDLNEALDLQDEVEALAMEGSKNGSP